MEQYFGLSKLGTNVKTEVRAGLATFLTMAYIIVVNPLILADAGMPVEGVVFATVAVSALSSILMGFAANLPFALAPGMGINAFFTYNIVIGLDVTWETALGAVFISGIVFLILSAFKVRELIVRAIPRTLRYAVASGIGLFLAFIGLQWAGFIVADPATLVSFGGLSVEVVLFAVGLFATSWLVIRRVPGALILGIVGTSVLAVIVSLILQAGGEESIVTIPETVFAMPSLEVFGSLDIAGALTAGMILPIFTLLFTDMFDSISTFVGVSEVGGFVEKDTGQPRNVGKALFVDAVSTTISGLFGTSSGTTYIESAAGVEEGGRTGLTAVVAGLLFLPFLFLSPLIQFVPQVAVAPVIVLVGVFMVRPVLSIEWTNFEESVPAFLALILIPLTYNITQGIVWGFLSYTIIKVLLGKGREVSLTLWIVDVLAIAVLIYGA
ncbi:MAG: NCS2 family permease [Spirochaetota bacterium]